MSKVKIQGHSSGSGTVTITAPNTNSDRTLTIPDITGTALTSADTGTVTQAIVHPDAVNRFISGRKNLIINGGFDVSQRGDFTSATNITTGDYYLDRFKQGHSLNGTTTATVTHKTNQVLPNGSYVNSLLMTLTVAGWCNTQQIVEEFNKLKGQTVTLSAWVKSNIATSINIYDGVTQTHSSSHTGGGQWEKLTVTQTISTISTLMRIETWTNVNRVSGDYFEIAQVQLELGSVATDFEHRSYGEELALCQRYFQTHYTLGSGVQNSATSALVYTSLPTSMRVTPTISAKSGNWNNINAERNDTYDISNVIIQHGASANDTDVDGVSSFVTTVDTTGSRPSGEGICVVMDRNGDEFYFKAEL
jgi:hypothetical protein